MRIVMRAHAFAETDRDWVTRRTRISVHAGCHRVRRIGALPL